MSMQKRLCSAVNPIYQLLCHLHEGHEGLHETFAKDGTRYRWNRLMTMTKDVVK